MLQRLRGVNRKKTLSYPTTISFLSDGGFIFFLHKVCILKDGMQLHTLHSSANRF